jgi:hypothetical protein
MTLTDSKTCTKPWVSQTNPNGEWNRPITLLFWNRV